MSIQQMRWIVIGGLCLLWELLPRLGLISSLFLPSLSSTFEVGIADWQLYWEAFGVTMHELLLTLVFACGGGVLAGIVLGAVPSARKVLLPIFSSMYAIPIVILYPLMVVWFGIGWESKVLLGAFYGFFPTVLATASGLSTVPKDLLLAAESMGATKTQKALYVIVPASVPVVLAGVRLGTALSIVGVVVGEMLTATGGIGFLISNFRSLLDSPRVYFAILMVVLIALIFDLAVGELERRTSSWRTGKRASEKGSRDTHALPTT